MKTVAEVTVKLNLEDASRLFSAAVKVFSDYNKYPDDIKLTNKNFLESRSLCGQMINLWWDVAKQCSKEEIMGTYGNSLFDREETKNMKFKCVIQLPGGGLVTEFITTNNLANLSDILQEKFPKSKVLSILGDYDSGE